MSKKVIATHTHTHMDTFTEKWGADGADAETERDTVIMRGGRGERKEERAEENERNEKE